uniref:NADH-ubiquinone oxidoreductase chain 6 n=1 Tax=Macromia daimoji TaxID=1168648 RepID=A0A411NHE8_9ODON|nr:NADH dehydrogenase subunit 6 [Macromia daimoji]QBF44110.1 NADH dehydrogenase subunit 6 [Macromia daimoji]
MSQIMILMFMISNTIIFSLMNHPMNMGLFLLIQTLLSCLMIGLTMQTTWFSYILFLVFLGGMMVLFIYMTSVASNEMFKKHNMILPLLMIIPILVLSLLFMDPFLVSGAKNQDVFMFPMNQVKQTEESLSMIYSYPTSMVTVFMVMYLLLTLIIIVYITKFNKGPLRMMN